MSALAALDFDPAPGDAGAVQDLLRTATGVASELEYLRQKLARIGFLGSGWEGQAALAFADRVGELPAYLEDASDAASLATSALSRWLEQLGCLKSRAAGYEREAATARAALRRATFLVEVARAEWRAAPPEAHAEAMEALSRAQQAADCARRHLEGVVRAAGCLLDEHQGLADAVARDLREAARFAPPEPGFFERVGKALDDLTEFVDSLPERVWAFVQDHAELIKAITSVVSDAVTLVALVAFVFGAPAVAGVAALVGAAAFGVMIVADAAGAEVSPLTHLGNLPGGGKLLTKGLGKLGRLGLPMLPGPARDAVEELAGPVVGGLGSYDEGGEPFEYWRPSSLGERALGSVSPVGLALWNAVHDGVRKDRARKAAEAESRWLR